MTKIRGQQISLDSTKGIDVDATGKVYVLVSTTGGLQFDGSGKLMNHGLQLSAGDPGTIVAGDMWYDTNRLAIRAATGMGNVSIESLLFRTFSDSNAVANTTTETSFTAANAQSYTTPASGLAGGNVLRLTAFGQFSTTGTPTLRLRCKIDGQIVYDTGAVTMASSVSSFAWSLHCMVTIRDTSGNFVAYGAGCFQSATRANQLDTTQKSGTFTLTDAATLEVTATWGTASSSNTVTMQSFVIEKLL